MSNIKFIDNVLSQSMIQIIKDFSRCGEVRHTYNFWSNDIIKDSNPILIKHLTDEIQCKLIEEIKYHLPEYTSIGCMWYGYMRGSYIPWHDDGSSAFGATIYLNEFWDEDWGGYFAYKEDNIRCIKPEFNKMVVIKTPVRHTVFNTTSVAPIRETIQIFGN